MDKKMFRFKLSDEIMNLITQFAKIHKYDDRHTYKSAWQGFVQRQDELFQSEIQRLVQLGYTGDVMDKIFKAGRYYFRAKKIEDADAEDTEDADTETSGKRREYLVMTSALITAMDVHLKNIEACKPSVGYAQFCETHIDVLRSEITRLVTTLSKEKIIEKIKKTYKNRYYIMHAKANK
jgi:hypothetical protein